MLKPLFNDPAVKLFTENQTENLWPSSSTNNSLLSHATQIPHLLIDGQLARLLPTEVRIVPGGNGAGVGFRSGGQEKSPCQRWNFDSKIKNQKCDMLRLLLRITTTTHYKFYTGKMEPWGAKKNWSDQPPIRNLIQAASSWDPNPVLPSETVAGPSWPEPQEIPKKRWDTFNLFKKGETYWNIIVATIFFSTRILSSILSMNIHEILRHVLQPPAHM